MTENETESADYDTEYSDASWDAYPDWPDYGEAKKKSPPPVKPSGGKSTYSPPRSASSDRPVTQSQLKEALGKVGQQISLNSTAIKTVDGRIRGMSDDHKKLGAIVRKETGGQKKDLEAVKRDVQQTKELAAIIPMFTASPTASTISKLAPLLFLLPGDTLSGGSSSSGSSSNSSGSLLGGSNLLAIAAIAVASGAFKP
jgi:hypothetical protein